MTLSVGTPWPPHVFRKPFLSDITLVVATRGAPETPTIVAREVNNIVGAALRSCPTCVPQLTFRVSKDIILAMSNRSGCELNYHCSETQVIIKNVEARLDSTWPPFKFVICNAKSEI
jgi:hypothetical protein